VTIPEIMRVVVREAQRPRSPDEDAAARRSSLDLSPTGHELGMAENRIAESAKARSMLAGLAILHGVPINDEENSESN
jgi:hypothetical protein